MRFGSCKNGPFHEAEKPHESMHAIPRIVVIKKFSLFGRNHSGKLKQWNFFSEMAECLALHIHIRCFPRRMHHFQNKYAAISSAYPKIVVVFARQRLRHY